MKKIKSSKDKFDTKLLEILACPVCKSDLQYKKQKNVLYCKKCKKEYPIKDGIPVFIEI